MGANPSIDTIGVFLDMSKAFDKVWHSGLIRKLQSYGIQSKLLVLLENYLSYRKQRVVLSGITSLWKPIKSGVPQGSVFGPLLFLIFINDLPDNLNCNPKLFANLLFVSLNAVMHNNDICSKYLKDDLNRLHEWSIKWKIIFNPDHSKPVEEAIFTKRNSISYPTISYSDVDVLPVDYHKHLGFVLDSKINYIKHIDGKIGKTNLGIGVIKRLYNHLPRKSLIQIYKSFIRPHLDITFGYHKPSHDDFYSKYYSDRAKSDPVNPNHEFINKIESAQNNVSLAITGCIRGTSREKLFAELGLTTLYDRRRFHRLFLRHYVPNSARISHNKHTKRYDVLPTRTPTFRHSFFPDTSNS